MGEKTLTAEEALAALNELRSNMIATQSASWSNLSYPLVAILNAAGYELDRDRSVEQKAQHLSCYGGAGGFPGALKAEPSHGSLVPELQAQVEALEARATEAEREREKLRGVLEQIALPYDHPDAIKNSRITDGEGGHGVALDRGEKMSDLARSALAASPDNTREDESGGEG